MFQRQGDIGFTKLNAVPEKAKDASPILAHGEVTGHCHQVAPTDLSRCDVFLDSAGNLIVNVKTDEPIKVMHDEHGALILDKGAWKVDRQVEYTPEGWRQVQD